jgi:hypothetical protein
MKLTFALLILAQVTHAGPRVSTSYTIATETTDGGGRRAMSTNYTNDGSVSLVAGLSTVAAPAETAKHGYIGQLYDIVGFVLNPTAAAVNEGGTLQLSGGQLLDDATQLAVPAASVAWSVAAGPLTGINASGLATAGSVYANTPATAQGNYAGNTSTLALTVLNGNLDNFGAYASDTLDDAWQVQYFGQPPNANAGPLIDADHDGQTNAFEYTADLIPTDANSVFRLRLEAVPGQSGQKRVIFSPRLTNRTYTVKAKPSLLTGTFTVLGSSSFSDNAQERTVTDLNASGATKFYQVEIVKP